ncbi:MAG: hypothetical protein E5X72_29890 [Mesorhizobium sp.]|nr:MAG: hypothetical protein E5X72_29890 [Mesorhizobium sp.]
MPPVPLSSMSSRSIRSWSTGPARCFGNTDRPAKVPRTRDHEAALSADVVELAKRHGRYGYFRIPALLRDAGWSVNHIRVRTLYIEKASPWELLQRLIQRQVRDELLNGRDLLHLGGGKVLIEGSCPMAWCR